METGEQAWGLGNGSGKGEQAWKLGNRHGKWGTGVERYSQEVVKALLFQYIQSCSENSGQLAKSGYWEVFLCKEDQLKLEPTMCRSVRDFPCKPTIFTKRGKQLETG